MSTIEVMQQPDALGTAVAAATAGDESAFAMLSERYRRELQLHCYRMLGSYEESEDLVQETFLRAWRKRETFQSRSTFRAWLYRIATNASLDALAKDPRRRGAQRSAGEPGTAPPADLPWLQPYPDHLLEGIATDDAGPDAVAVSKETIELAFLVAIQHMPPRQRAVLILRDVLGWSAKDTGALLESSVAAVNSALQRARATLKEHLPERRSEWPAAADPSREERALLQRYLDATERADADAFIEIMRDDARFTMPPEPGAYDGARTIVESWKAGGFTSEGFGEMRGVLTRANMQPAVACYLRRPDDPEFRALALDVLRIEGGAIAEIVTFPDTVFAAFDLPPTL